MRTPNTFLLYWNPYFSSYKIERFMNDFKFANGRDILSDDDEWDKSPDRFNWSVAEYDKAHAGDRFIFIRVGYEKPTGIVGVGHFTSEPYRAEDWSGQGRAIYYMDMEWETVINPRSDLVLKTHELIKAIPEIMWSKGRAGVIVAPEIAAKIDLLWKNHIDAIKTGSNAIPEHEPSQSTHKITAENTLGFVAENEIFQEFLHGKRSTFTIAITNETFSKLLENKNGHLVLQTETMPEKFHECYYYNGGVFPYILKKGLEYIILICNDKRIVGKIVDYKLSAGKRFRFGKNADEPSVYDPNGDNCIWSVTFKLTPAK